MNLRFPLLLCCILLGSGWVHAQEKVEFFAGGNLSAVTFSTEARFQARFPYYEHRIRSYGSFGNAGFQAGLRRQFPLPDSKIWLSAGIAYSNQRQEVRLTKDRTTIGELDISFADRIDNLAFPFRAGLTLGELSFKGGLTGYYTLTRKYTEIEQEDRLSITGFESFKKASFLENTAQVNRFRTALAVSVGYQFPQFPRLGVELQYEKYLTPFWETTLLGDTHAGSNFQLNLSYALKQPEASHEASSDLMFIAGIGLQPMANLGKYPTEAKSYVSGLVGIGSRWSLGKGQLESGIQYQERNFIVRGHAPNMKLGGNNGDAMQVALHENLKTRIVYLSVPVMYVHPLGERLAGKAGLYLHTAVRKNSRYEPQAKQGLSLNPALAAGLSYQLNTTFALGVTADQFVSKVSLDAGHEPYAVQFAVYTEISL